MSSAPLRVLQYGKIMDALDHALASEFNAHLLSGEQDPAAFLARHGGEFDALVTSAAMGTPAGLIEALPQLRFISSFGVGYDALDRQAILARGIPVGYTPGVLDDCVADLAFGLLIDASRGIAAADRFVRSGQWSSGKFGLQHKVSGKRLGILGMGRIGRTVARRASGFDMEVAYHNRSPIADSAYAYKASVQALAEWSDFLVVTAAGGGASRHLVDATVLQALGSKGFLINVARGSVVDEAALLQALHERRIAGAGLDVFEDEPRPLAGLLALDNVVLAPHMASATYETRQAMADLVLDNLRSFTATGHPKVAVPW